MSYIEKTVNRLLKNTAKTRDKQKQAVLRLTVKKHTAKTTDKQKEAVLRCTVSLLFKTTLSAYYGIKY